MNQALDSCYDAFHNYPFFPGKQLNELNKPTRCINIAERDLQMQAGNAFEPNNNVSVKVHRKLTLDCHIFRHARSF
jgi:hypothetical protein